METPALKLWEVEVAVTGYSPDPTDKWEMIHGFFGDEPEVFSRTFTILAPNSEDAMMWVKALLSDFPNADFKPPVQKQLDVIIHEVTDLAPLLRGH